MAQGRRPPRSLLTSRMCKLPQERWLCFRLKIACSNGWSYFGLTEVSTGPRRTTPAYVTPPRSSIECGSVIARYFRAQFLCIGQDPRLAFRTVACNASHPVESRGDY